MRRQPSANVLLAAAALAAAAATLASPLAARADTGSTFSNFAADVSLNDAGSFLLSGLGGTGQLTVDPNNPDTLFAINRVGTAAGGVYAFSLSTQTRISNTNGPVFIGNAAPMTWSSTSNDPYSGVVGNDGNFYVSMYTTCGVYKIENPLSDAPTITRIMSSYNNPATGGTDDDVANIARMPATFGLANYTANDLILFDDGNNADGINTVAALHTNGSDGNSPTIVWQRSSPSPTGTIHGATNPVDGYAYWINTVPEHNTIDGTDRVSLYRVKGDGVLQTIGLTLPAGVTLDHADDPIAINPVDGSLWLADSIFDSGGADTQARTMLRIDTAHLTPSTSDANQLIADVTAEFSAASLNIGVNGLAFNNDGTQLFIGTPNGTDKLWAINVTPATATPVHHAGDTNNDGVVDLTDLNNVLNNFGVTATGNAGDDNADGVVDLTDLNNVLNNFGVTYAASALNVVPEPASLSLLAIGAAALIGRRRRSR